MIDTMKMLKYTGDPWEDVFKEEVRICVNSSMYNYLLIHGIQFFPKTAVENLPNPFPVLTWHGVNMAEGLKALPATYRFTHNQSGERIIPVRHPAQLTEQILDRP